MILGFLSLQWSRWPRMVSTILALSSLSYAEPNNLPPAREATMRNASFVIFDLETTGLKAEDDRILEIGAVRVEAGMIRARQTWLVNPGIPIPAGSQRIHGIRPEMVAGAPPFSSVYPLFTNFVGNSVLMSHNARFDRKFLAAEIRRNGLQPPDIVLLDTLRLFKQCFPKRRSYSLANLTADLCPLLLARESGSSTNNLPRERRFHSAGWDAECTANLLLRALETLEPDLPAAGFEKHCGGQLSLVPATPRPPPTPPPPQNGKFPGAPAR